MGFLLGAFGKQNAAIQKIQIQADQLKISRKLRSTQNQINRMDRQLQRAEQYGKNNIAVQINNAKAAALAGITADPQTDPTGYNQAYYKASLELQLSNEIEYYRESQYEPLKQEEEYLTSEKERLESEAQIVGKEYEFCQKMEQDGAKSLIPQYNGG